MSTQKYLSDTLLGGLIPYLESCPDVNQVKIYSKAPCSSTLLRIWEREKRVQLPPDLSQLLHLTDGLTIKWSVSSFSQSHGNYDLRNPPVNQKWMPKPYTPSSIDLGVGTREDSQDKSIPMGEIHVNGIEFMSLVYDPFHGDATSSSPEHIPPGLCFVLHDISNIGKVCLCFHKSQLHVKESHRKTIPAKQSKSEIWFYSYRSKTWSFLAHTFTDYFRLMISNLGIFGWQLAYSETGLPESTFECLGFFVPRQARFYSAWRAKQQFLEMKSKKEQGDISFEYDSILYETGIALPSKNWWSTPSHTVHASDIPNRDDSRSISSTAGQIFQLEKMLKLCSSYAALQQRQSSSVRNEETQSGNITSKIDRPPSAASSMTRRSSVSSRRPTTAPATSSNRRL